MQSKNIIQKEYNLREFYLQHLDDIALLCQNCDWKNIFYEPKKAMELLNGDCESDGYDGSVLALFALHDDREELIAFFPYSIQTNRWLLPIKSFISWWDVVIGDNVPLIHRDYTKISFYYLAYFLKEKRAVFLIHLCLDSKFVEVCDKSSVHIKADYNDSNSSHKIYITNSNITSLFKLHYARIVEISRIKIRDILS